MDSPPSLAYHFCYLAVGEWITQVPADASTLDLRLIMPGGAIKAPAPRHLKELDLGMEVGANGCNLPPYPIPSIFDGSIMVVLHLHKSNSSQVIGLRSSATPIVGVVQRLNLLL